MNNSTSDTQGIELLVKKCRNEFRQPENTNHYTQDDYKEAERKFIKFCLRGIPIIEIKDNRYEFRKTIK